MKRVNFQNGTKTQEAKVTIDSTDYEVTPAVWTGTTPLSAFNLNKMQDNIEEEVNITLDTEEPAEEVEITNTAPVNGKIDVSGNSTQETRSGKNILNINATPSGRVKIDSVSIVDSKITLVKDTSSTASSSRYVLPITLEPNTDYIITGKAKILNNTAIGNSNIRIRTGATSGQTLAQGVLDITSIEEQNISVTFNSSNNTAMYFWFDVDSNATVEGATLARTVEYTDMMVRKATTTSDYEQYGVQPSPDYPSKIHNVGDNVNLFDKSASATYSRGIDTTEETLETGKKIISSVTSSSNEYGFKLYKLIDLTDYVGKTVTMKASFIKSNNTLVPRYQIGLCDSSGGNRIDKINSTVSNQAISFVVPELDGTSIYLAVWLYVTQSTPITSGDYVEFTDIKLEIGDEAIATSYSPYNCGNTNIEVSNKNLFNALLGINAYINGTTGAVVDNNNNWLSDYIKIESNTDYVLSFSQSVYNIGVAYFDDNKNFISRKTYGNKTSQTFSHSTAKYVRISINPTDTQVDANIIMNTYHTQLEKSSIPSLYVPHQEQLRTFPFTEGQRMYLGDYLASNGTHHKRKQVIFDGTENWQTTEVKTNTALHYLLNLSPLASSSVIMCNIVPYDNLVYTQDRIGGYIPNTTKDRIFIRETHLTNADWKTYLATQYANGTPVILEYELAEEIIEPYTDEQAEAYYQLQHTPMYEGLTYAECIDETKCKTIVEYYYNNDLNKTYAGRIDGIDERIDDLEKREVYSTTEEIVGIWKGKPLYRKIVELSEAISLYTTTADIELPFTNISNMWICDKSTIVNNNNLTLPFPFANPADVISNQNGDVSGYIKIENGVPTLKIRKGQGTAIASESFVLEYTKTTD